MLYACGRSSTNYHLYKENTHTISYCKYCEWMKQIVVSIKPKKSDIKSGVKPCSPFDRILLRNFSSDRLIYYVQQTRVL